MEELLPEELPLPPRRRPLELVTPSPYPPDRSTDDRLRRPPPCREDRGRRSRTRSRSSSPTFRSTSTTRPSGSVHSSSAPSLPISSALCPSQATDMPPFRSGFLPCRTCSSRLLGLPRTARSRTTRTASTRESPPSSSRSEETPRRHTRRVRTRTASDPPSTPPFSLWHLERYPFTNRADFFLLAFPLSRRPMRLSPAF